MKGASSRRVWGLSDITEQISCRCFLHFDVGEKFLASVFQTGSEDVDHVVDDQETVVVALAVVDRDGRVLLIMALDVELQLSQILRLLVGIDSG